MNIEKYNPISIDWSKEPAEKVNGETGFSLIKTLSIGTIKIRQIEYSNNYFADHWCDKGHIVYVVSGEIEIEHKNSETHLLKLGMTYLVGDKTVSHKVKSEKGAVILIVD